MTPLTASRYCASRSVAAARSTGLRHAPLQKPRKQPRLSALKMFLEALGTTPPIVAVILEGEIEAAAKHSEIIFWPIDHAEAQIASQTDVPRDSEFETGSELAE
jgi:hypothetical protein